MVFLAGLAVVGGQLENDQPSPPKMFKGWSGEKPAALSDVRPGGGPKWDAEGRKNSAPGSDMPKVAMDPMTDGFGKKVDGLPAGVKLLSGPGAEGGPVVGGGGGGDGGAQQQQRNRYAAFDALMDRTANLTDPFLVSAGPHGVFGPGNVFSLKKPTDYLLDGYPKNLPMKSGLFLGPRG